MVHRVYASACYLLFVMCALFYVTLCVVGYVCLFCVFVLFVQFLIVVFKMLSVDCCVFIVHWCLMCCCLIS